MAGRKELRTFRQSAVYRALRGWGTAFATLALVLSLGLLAPTAQADGDLVWAHAMGGWGNDGGAGIAVDGAGNVYTTGYFRGNANFGPFLLNSAGGSDIFVAKQGPDGTFLWARSMGGTANDVGRGIAVDGAGNVYTTGYFRGTANFGPFQLTAGIVDYIFVAKLDTNGNFVWARAMGGMEGDWGNDIAVDGAGNVYTTGHFWETTDFDPGPGTYELTSEGGYDIFVSKLDSNGDFVWARSMGGSDNDYGEGIALDAAGNIYTTGRFRGTVDFDPGPDNFSLTSAGSQNVFVSKLDADGNFVWARALGGSEAGGIALDYEGNIYTTGWFYGTADFDPGPGTFNLSATGIYDIFVSKLDAEGDFVWARSMGGTSWVIGESVAVDATGNVYTTGYFHGTADFDPGPGTFERTSAGWADIFVSKLDADGDFVWARAMGGMSDDLGQSIAVDGAGNVYATGTFLATADFDPGPETFNLTSSGVIGIFVLKLSGLDVSPPNAIGIAPATTGPTNAASVEFTVEFDEPVKGFDDISDLVINHWGTASTGASITGGPEAYTVSVEGISGDGAFTLAVETASGVEDLVGNPLASSVTSAPVIVDNTPPVVTVLGVSPAALEPGDTALIQFAVNEMLLGDPVVRVAGGLAAVAPLEVTKSLGHSYAWTAPADLPVGRITGRPFIPGVGYTNPDPWPYGPQPLEIMVTDLAGNTVTYTDPHGLALVSGLTAGWPVLAALALLGAGAFVLRRRSGTA